MQQEEIKPNRQMKDGATPLYVAVYLGHLDIVTILLEAKVNLDCLFQGQSPLQLATEAGHTAIAKLLEKARQSTEEIRPGTMPHG